VKRDVTVIGPLNVDLLVRGEAPRDLGALGAWAGPADIELAVAGSVGYTAQDLARLGLKTAVSARVADDPFGPVILSELAAAGVDVRGVRTVPGTQSGIGAYVLAFGSRKRPLFYRLPTHDPWPVRYDAAEREDLLDARALHNGGYLHFTRMYDTDIVGLFAEARRRGLVTSVDSQFPLHEAAPPWMPAMERLLPSLDYLFCDAEEAAGLTGEPEPDRAAGLLRAAGARTVIIKRGADGSDVFTPDGGFHQDAMRVGELVDSIGAGDAYDAAFLAARLEGKGLEECALFASVVAGATVTAPGGCAGMPDRAAALELLGRHAPAR
jgi:ribokinase